MLKRLIEVVEYDPQWRSLFLKEQALLAQAIGSAATNIEHIGSTSVPNLAAKPIIDILVEVATLSALDTRDEAFRALGYEVKGENGIKGRRYYQKGGNARSHHVHAFQSGSEDLVRHRAFKAYLIAKPKVAAEYAKVKLSAAKACEHDNEVYMSLKNDFITKHERLALQWQASLE